MDKRFIYLSTLAFLAVAACSPAAETSEKAPATAPVKVSETPKPPAAGDWIKWDSSDTPAAYDIDGLKIEVSRKQIAAGEEPVWRGVVKVTAPDGSTFRMEGEEGFGNVGVGVGRLDAASPHPQVVVSTSVRGNYCCDRIDVLDHAGGRWKRISFSGLMYNNWSFPKDLDGDGLAELVLDEKAFVSRFNQPYRSGPPMIIQVRNGAASNVSAEARFQPYFRTRLADFRDLCEKEKINGACANYVATAIRAGQGDQAWAAMLKAYDDTDPNTKTIYCDQALGCTKTMRLDFLDFPAALSFLLRELGYKPMPAAAIAKEDEGPDF